jgi:hypothetical protein
MRIGGIEDWTTPNGEVLEIGWSATPFIIAETSVGELELCEACYTGGLPAFFEA